MIFDEPTNGLDIMTARSIIEFIRECRDRDKTVIFSTHIMSESKNSATPSASFIRQTSLRRHSCAASRSTSRADLEDIFVKVVAPTMSLRRPTDMSARNIGIVYRKELTEALRDRRTLITMFVLPIIIFSASQRGLRRSYRRANWKGERRKS